MRRKYFTEEEQLEARRASSRKLYHQRRGINEDGSYLNLGKKHRINEKNGFNITIETQNRLDVKVLCITIVVTFVYTNDQDAFNDISDSIYCTFKDWLDNCGDFSKRERIFLFKAPENNHNTYKGKYSSVTSELWVKRVTETENFDKTVKLLMPLINSIIEGVKKTCSETGLTIKYRERNKKLETDVLPSGSS